MRARAGDPPRTMAQKILAARSGDRMQAAGVFEVDVDQIALARSVGPIVGEAVASGWKKATAEVAVAYEGRCITDGSPATSSRAATADDERGLHDELLARGVVTARAGAGFPAPVHLERFASPARLCVTDEPRLAGVGGAGMMALVVPPTLLVQGLLHGKVAMRPPVSVEVTLTGRLRPFVCPRDVALELVRRGLPDVVRRVEEARGAPVVVEFAGPSARSLSVGDRSVLAGIAPQLGAAAAVFVSDERTEVFLRDQRRSKAYRPLAPDAGAPFEEVLMVDLGAVDPLLLDEEGRVRAVRDLAGQPVSQALLGGDSGATLRDLLAVAALLKSKRVPPRLDFLMAVPSRQMLEVLAEQGALADLIATGARLIEPDARLMSEQLYPPPRAEVSLRTCDPEPRAAGERRPVVASPETLAFAVATGQVGDPRAFKRPVRVTVPRSLPTDDVLVIRKGYARKGEKAPAGPKAAIPKQVDGPRARGAKGPEPVSLGGAPPATAAPWRTAQTLELVDSSSLSGRTPTNGHADVAVVCSSLDEVRDVAERAPEIARSVRAVLAPYIPSALVALLSAAGIAALRLDAAHAKSLKGQRSIALPAPSQWAEHGATPVQVGAAKLPMTWLAQAHERAWATGDAAWRSASPANLVDRRGPSLAGDAGRRGASPVRA